MRHFIKVSKKFLALFLAFTLTLPFAAPSFARGCSGGYRGGSLNCGRRGSGSCRPVVVYRPRVYCAPSRSYYCGPGYYRPYYCDSSAVAATVGVTTGVVLGAALTANRQRNNCACSTSEPVIQSQPLIMHRFH